jgi:hypothetical protein
MNKPSISPDEAHPAFTLKVTELPDGTYEAQAVSHPHIRTVAASRQAAMSGVEGALRKLIFKQ